MTVVIPAYNEGAMVALAIDSIAQANYPPTGWRSSSLTMAAPTIPGSIFNVPSHAMERGFWRLGLRATAESARRSDQLPPGPREIFVTVDSDSVVAPNALLALAGPFASKQVGVVAGKVLVYNKKDGIIPRMLHVRFTLAFDFLRAYQSTYGTVYCSPGALSAYRASAVMAVLEPWLKQSFLGAPASIGEDRALTNDIMRIGFDSIYQRTAVVLTIVPNTYRQLYRMLLRWNRSYIREEMRFALIVWKRPPLARLISLCDSFITNLRYPVALLTLILLVSAFFGDLLVLPRVLVAIGMISFVYSLYYLRSERSFNIVYGILYEFFSFFLLFWVFPWSLLTVRTRGWLTR